MRPPAGGALALYGTSLAGDLLFDHGTDRNARASLRKRFRLVTDETLHEYRDVPPLAWGERLHDQAWVSRAAMHRIHAPGERREKIEGSAV